MTVLVTGATGFIGGALTHHLLAAGERVRVLAREPEKLARAGLSVAEVSRGDITDAAAVERAVAGVDTVYAIAGTFREPSLSDERYREVNVEAVRLMLEAAQRHGVRRVVHCSTVGIHGNVTGAPANEATPIRPEGIYEITKAAGDQLALDRARRGGGPEVVVIRPAPVYGPGDTRLVKLFKLAARDRVILLGDGSPHYHMIFIDDLVEAFRLAGTTPGISGEAFIIAGNECPTLGELIHKIGRLTGHPEQKILKLPAGPVLALSDLCERICRPLGIDPPIYRRRVEFFVNNRAYDITKARTRLGFQPRIGLDEGLARTASWYKEEGFIA
ncbi:NAD-dependent epimerase/dehydratase family protein [Benzoatithermus flavus]|uniref:NAD-dependent epimerase/dehydratase family protein n=1 Tax=Benzoatithermus flavus TaxID=3108223 RepID=A0ABU8XVW8_9PROT